MYITKKNTEALLVVSKVTGLEEIAGSVMSQQQYVRRNNIIEKDN